MHDILWVILDFIGQALTVLGWTLLEILSGGGFSECMQSSNDKTGLEEKAIIKVVVERAPQIKTEVNIGVNISDSYHDDVPKAVPFKETIYNDLADFKNTVEKSKEFNTKASVGIGAFFTAWNTKNLGTTGAGTMGGIVGSSCYLLGDSHLNSKYKEYALMAEIQKMAFSKGCDEIGGDKVNELAKIRCEESGVFENLSNENINKAAGNLYNDIINKK